MATSRIDRSDDTAAVLKIIATVSDSEDAVTKQWQGVYVADGTSPSANKMGVDASGHAQVDIAAASVTVPVSAAALPLPSGASTAAKQPALGTAGTASTDVITVQGIASMTKLLVTPDANSAVNMAQVGGTNVVTGGVNGSQGVGGLAAHSATVSGNPLLGGCNTIAFGANPTAVDAGEVSYAYANRHGIPLVTGPHMNPFSEEYTQTDATGAVTDAALKTVSAGTKIAITQIQVLADQSNTVETSVRVGFAAATLSAASTTPVAGIVVSHPGLVPGAGISRGDGMGIIAIGADGEDLRVTMSDPVGGNNVIIYSGFTIES